MNVKSIPRMQRGLPKKSPIPSVARVVAVSSAKGGVGKSTTAVNLAISLSRLGRKTGLLDTDLFGPSIPKMMNLCGKPFTTPNDKLIPLLNYGVECMSMGFLVDEKDPVVWRGMMVMKGLQDLIRNVAWNNLDMLVIDMPPGTGDTQLTLSQLVEIDGALIVSTPQDVAMADTLKGIAMFEKLNVPARKALKLDIGNGSKYEHLLLSKLWTPGAYLWPRWS